MKNFYLIVALFVCAQGHVNAQLLNNKLIDTNTLTNDLTQRVDDTTELIKRKAEQSVDRIKPGIDKIANSTEKLIDPLIKLPQQLPILNSAGKPAFVDVEVEHGWRAVEREWLIMLDESELINLQKLPVEILEKTRFDELDLTLVRFRAPVDLDSIDALKKQLPEKFSTRLDRNHIYTSQINKTPNEVTTTSLAVPICTNDIKIGMIDTAIKADHLAFKASANKITQKNFLDEQMAQPDAHGTAVAGLLLGQGEELKPLLPNASLYSASVFYAQNEYSQGATMINLVRALNWLISENVSVINMSLAGPDNQILAKVISKTISSGKVVVAAAGNEGPAAPPMFPAAYPGVIAATAVDKEQHIYRWANRGNHIYFSTMGVSVLTARSSGGFGRESGTSMAAPIVAAFVACELVQNIAPSNLLERLSAKATDLGEQGRDPVFGVGVLDAIQKRALNISDASVSE